MSPLLAGVVLLLGAFAIYCDYFRTAWFPFTKGLPIVVLILALGRELFGLPAGAPPLPGEGVAWWIWIGLLLGLAGDLLLLKKEYFLFGLAAFLQGHLCYVAAFAGDYAWRVELLVPIALFGLGFGGLLCYFLIKNDRKSYLVPVALYIIVICLMLVYALHSDLEQAGVVRAFGAGALLFAASDALLALNRFARRFPEAQLMVLATYYSAQLCIAAGAMSVI